MVLSENLGTGKVYCLMQRSNIVFRLKGNMLFFKKTKFLKEIQCSHFKCSILRFCISRCSSSISKQVFRWKQASLVFLWLLFQQIEKQQKKKKKSINRKLFPWENQQNWQVFSQTGQGKEKRLKLSKKETKETFTKLKEMKRFIREYYEQLYANKTDKWNGQITRQHKILNW